MNLDKLHRPCEICGEERGGGGHEECSKIIKGIYGGECENKHPQIKLSKKQADNAGIFFRDKYR